MYQKWKFAVPLLMALVIGFFLFPREGLAVEYSITNVKIDAYLQGNGSVDVTETHTYSFDGEFNGITREIIPKEGSSIKRLKATENGKSLRVEKEDDLYKIHRKGADETITVSLVYSIENGMDVYNDIAEFYWPFFDERNESSYENLQITIHPPKKTADVIAFGYDEAFKTEQIAIDGSVLFKYEEVPSGTNGDIRVAYDAKLFPGAPLTANKSMRDVVLNAQQELLDQAAAEARMRENLSKIARVGVPSFSILLLFLIISSYMRVRFNRSAVERESKLAAAMPQQIMSLPATITYTHTVYQPAEVMAAALMDLVRKGFAKKTANNQFQVGVSHEKALKHEQILINFLFNEVSSNGTFSFDDLKAYTLRTTNHAKYQSNQSKWIKAVREEIKEHELYEKNGKYRWFIGLTSLIILPFIFLFAIYNLMGWFAVSIVLFFTVIIFAIAYHPKTWKGLVISHEWSEVKRHLKELNIDEWKLLTEDDRLRAYIYGLGIKEKTITAKNNQLVKSFEIPDINPANHNSFYPGVDFATFTYFGPMAATHFYSANQITTPQSDSTSSSGGGGGTGGGGGGSGAF